MISPPCQNINIFLVLKRKCNGTAVYPDIVALTFQDSRLPERFHWQSVSRSATYPEHSLPRQLVMENTETNTDVDPEPLRASTCIAHKTFKPESGWFKSPATIFTQIAVDTSVLRMVQGGSVIVAVPVAPSEQGCSRGSSRSHW